MRSALRLRISVVASNVYGWRRRGAGSCARVSSGSPPVWRPTSASWINLTLSRNSQRRLGTILTPWSVTNGSGAAANCLCNTPQRSPPSRAPMALNPLSSRRSGASNRTTERSAAIARSSAPPRRSPASAAAKIISVRNFYRRWKSCSAATCQPITWLARGLVLLGRPSSCRRRSSAMRLISTVTGGVM